VQLASACRTISASDSCSTRCNEQQWLMLTLQDADTLGQYEQETLAAPEAAEQAANEYTVRLRAQRVMPSLQTAAVMWAGCVQPGFGQAALCNATHVASSRGSSELITGLGRAGSEGQKMAEARAVSEANGL
jgi:hypothetical protein